MSCASTHVNGGGGSEYKRFHCGTRAFLLTPLNTDRTNSAPKKRAMVVATIAVIFGLVVPSVFLWVFTGVCSPLKNRVAIGFSYAFTVAVLISPFLVADSVTSSASARAYLQNAPVGLAMARLHEDKVQEEPQWIVSIGGQASAGEKGSFVVPLYVLFFLSQARRST